MERFTPWIWSTIWPIFSLSFDNRFPDPWNLPSISLHPSWFIPHFFLIPVLESRKDNLDIQVKCRDLPSMSSLSPPRVPLIADNIEIQDNLGYPRPLARTMLIFMILSERGLCMLRATLHPVSSDHP